MAHSSMHSFVTGMFIHSNQASSRVALQCAPLASTLHNQHHVTSPRTAESSLPWVVLPKTLNVQKLKRRRITTAATSPRLNSPQPDDVDSDLYQVLELATDNELEQIYELLYGASFTHTPSAGLLLFGYSITPTI